MKVALNLILIISCICNGYSQSKNSIDISLGSVREKDYNLHFSNLRTAGIIPNIDNRYAGFLAINYEYKNKSHFSPVIGVKLLSRMINYTYLDAAVKGFSHNTFEVPLALRYSSSNIKQYSWYIDLGSGVNKVLTSNGSTEYQIVSETNTNFQFVNSSKAEFFAHAKFGVESKINDNQKVIFFIGYQYQLTPMFYFRATGDLITLNSGNVNTNYLSFGLSYQFNLK